MHCPWKLVVFDWDGTLMPTTDLIVKSIQYTNARMGYRVPSVETIEMTIGMGRNDVMRIVAPECREEHWEVYEKIYRDYYVAAENGVDLFDGAKELLQGLLNVQAVLAVATGKSERGLKRVLARTGLENYFEFKKATFNSVPKPAPDMLFEISREASVQLKDMVMVGDGRVDLEMAQNAGIDAIGVLFGACRKETLEKLPNVGLAKDFDELTELLIKEN